MQYMFPSINDTHLSNKSKVTFFSLIMEQFYHVGVINQDNKMIQMSDKFKQGTKSVAAAPAARISWRLCLTVSYLEPIKRGLDLKQIADLIVRIEKADKLLGLQQLQRKRNSTNWTFEASKTEMANSDNTNTVYTK